MDALVDASFLVALHDSGDANHARAVRARANVMPGPFLWNTVTFAETHFRFARASGVSSANTVLGQFAGSSHSRYATLSEADHTNAMALCARVGLKTGDGLMAAHALRLGVPLLTFDADFRKVKGLRAVGL